MKKLNIANAQFAEKDDYTLEAQMQQFSSVFGEVEQV